MTSLPKGHLPPCLIGHGFYLGEQIPLIKQRHDCKWIQVVHTAPEELGMYKSYEEAIFKGEQKHQAEVKLCELADQFSLLALSWQTPTPVTSVSVGKMLSISLQAFSRSFSVFNKPLKKEGRFVFWYLDEVMVKISS